MEDIKHYLSRYLVMKQAARRIRSELEEADKIDIERIEILRGSLILPSSASDGMPRTRNSKDRITEIEAQIDEIQREINARHKGLLQQLEAIRRFLEQIEDEIRSMDDETSKAVLRARYIEGLTWYDISRMLQYSEFYCKKELHIKALEEFSEKKRRKK